MDIEANEDSGRTEDLAILTMFVRIKGKFNWSNASIKRRKITTLVEFVEQLPADIKTEARDYAEF